MKSLALLLVEYAVKCNECGLDLITNDSRSKEVLARSINRKEQSIFFYVSPLKLFVMSTVTFGLYEMWWFYKNWFYVEDRTYKKLWPFGRSIFRQITYYWLLKQIQRAGAEQNIPFPVPPAGLAIAYLAFDLLGLLPAGHPAMYLGYLSPLPLIPAQQYINSLNRASPTPINSRFSVLNWIAIVIFVVITAYQHLFAR